MEINPYLAEIYQALQNTALEKLAEHLPAALARRQEEYRHGQLDGWLQILQQLPHFAADSLHLQKEVRIEQTILPSQEEQDSLRKILQKLHPWRKGPWFIHGLHLDTEWRSDWKWDRIRPHIQPLAGRYVLDVGTGNGYHCWRMLGEGAKWVLGIDPSQLFWMQFLAMKHFLGKHPVYFLPLGLEYLPQKMACFDSIFSMGVLYHRKSPFDHLQHLHSLLRQGGELILETLVIKGGAQSILVPRDRYACMGNVWFLPSPLLMQCWLEKCGFHEVRLVDINQTSIEEQRRTDWMQFQSLEDFLDPQNPTLTREGYPAPLRATFVARK